MQMLLFAMLIHAAHPAFEDREIAFNSIRGYVAACVLFLWVIERFMRRKFLANLAVKAAFIGL
jgi:hypothetical protein